VRIRLLRFSFVPPATTRLAKAHRTYYDPRQLWSTPPLESTGIPARSGPPSQNKASIWPTVRELHRQVQRVCPFLPILPRQGQVSHARPFFVYALLTHSIFRTHSTHITREEHTALQGSSHPPYSTSIQSTSLHHGATALHQGLGSVRLLLARPPAPWLGVNPLHRASRPQGVTRFTPLGRRCNGSSKGLSLHQGNATTHVPPQLWSQHPV